MKKDDLMRYARELGVETRQAGPDGKKKNRRAVGDVKKDCKAAQARLCQPLQEASSSSREAPLPAPERATNVEGGVANLRALRQKAAII